MIIHTLPGLGTQPLSYYLAALGIARVLAHQEDPDLRFGWHGETFQIQTSVDDLEVFLMERYRPTPVLSPWNGGSGFGEKDKAPREFLDRIADCEADRLAPFRRSIDIVRRVMSRDGADVWPKGRLVQELRNQLPDDAIEWIDAAIVLTGDLKKPGFPPLLGTGGNDGRFDFSTNFHQRLCDVLPELGANAKISSGWLTDMLQGTASTPLKKAAVGQFDAAAAGGPGSSFDEGTALINPWLFALMLEGSLWFATSATRRFGSVSAHAAIPFTVSSSMVEPLVSPEGDPSRGELWAPVVEMVAVSHFEQIMREARAAWQGRSARTGVQMRAAAKLFGVDRGIARFRPFAFLQRNGLAFTAVARDSVWVERSTQAALIQQPMARVEVFCRNLSNAALSQARRFEQALTVFLEELTPGAFVDVLAHQTRVEQVVLQSRSGRENVTHTPRRLAVSDARELIAPLLEKVPEARIAAGIASGFVEATAFDNRDRSVQSRSVPVRRLLLHTSDGEGGGVPPVRGFGLRPLYEVLTDALVWLAQHLPEDPHYQWGFAPLERHQFWTPWQDAHAWALGWLDDQLVEYYLTAFLSLEWDGSPLRHQTRDVDIVDPGLAMLQTFICGALRPVGAPVHRAVPLNDDPNDNEAASSGPVGATGDGLVIGLRRDWPVRLRANQVDGVLSGAAAELARRRVVLRSGALTPDVIYRSTGGHPSRLGSRYAAALMLHGTTEALSATGSLRAPTTTLVESSTEGVLS